RPFMPAISAHTMAAITLPIATKMPLIPLKMKPAACGLSWAARTSECSMAISSVCLSDIAHSSDVYPVLPKLLTDSEAAHLRRLYTDDGLFRSTIDMAPKRYGAGQYRYFRAPCPEPIEDLKQALYPK